MTCNMKDGYCYTHLQDLVKGEYEVKVAGKIVTIIGWKCIPHE